jgi:serine protease Do
MPRERRGQGLGSGVVVRPGVIVTNNHVVQDADQITVTTHDGREFNAEVAGTDPKSDLAVLRLHGDSSMLKPIQLGDSSRLRLGDVVLAIGNPFGVGQTVTMGIVSAKGRADVGIIDYEDFIQTDAAINPGNSGGALVNMEGKLVGINTAILSRSGGYQGIGFAIPADMARPIIDSLLRHGKVVRGWLGVSIQDIDQDLAKALGLESVTGVLISDVGADTPAAKAGLQRGDVVLEVDGKTVDSTGRLRNLIASAGAAARVRLDILREGKRRSVEVSLGEVPGSPPEAGPAKGGGRAEEPTTLDGLTLEGLTARNRSRFQIPATVKSGVVVTGVRFGSPFARAGLRAGDVIVELNRSKVSRVARFKQLWKRSKGKTLLLLSRRGRMLYVVVDH